MINTGSKRLVGSLAGNSSRKKETIEKALRFLSSLDWEEGIFTDEDTQQAWESIRQTLRLSGEPARPRPIVVQADNRFRAWRKVAAVVTLFLLAGSVYPFIEGYNREVRYPTGYGNTRKIELPDGSLVTLNGNSTLSSRIGMENGPGR